MSIDLWLVVVFSWLIPSVMAFLMMRRVYKVDFGGWSWFGCILHVVLCSAGVLSLASMGLIYAVRFFVKRGDDQ